MNKVIASPVMTLVSVGFGVFILGKKIFPKRFERFANFFKLDDDFK